MPVDRSNLTGVALVLLAGILWGAMGTSVQYLFSSGAFETPLELVTLRQLCAGSLFVLVMSLVRPQAIWRLWTDRRMVIDAAVSGALLFGAHNAFFESIFYSNAGTGAILLVTVPLWCGLWSAIVNRRPVPRLEIACFLLAAAGVSLIVTDGDLSGLVFSPMAIVWGLVSSFMPPPTTSSPSASSPARASCPRLRGVWSSAASGRPSSAIRSRFRPNGPRRPQAPSPFSFYSARCSPSGAFLRA